MTDKDNTSQPSHGEQPSRRRSSGRHYSHGQQHQQNRPKNDQNSKRAEKPNQPNRNRGRRERSSGTSIQQGRQQQAILDTGSQSILNITNLAVIAVLIGLIVFIVKIISVFGIFIFSFIIAFLLYPMVDWFSNRRVPRVWSILIVYLVIGSLLFGIGAAIVPTIIGQATSLLKQLPQIAIDLQQDWTPRLETLEKYLNEKGVTTEEIKNYVDQIVPTLQEWAAKFGNWFLSGLQGAVGGIVALFSVPIIVFYLLLDAPKIRDNLMGLVPRRTAGDVHFLLSRLSNMLNHYIRGQLLLCFIIFAMETTGLLILGVPHALLLGVLGGLTEVVPIVGPIIAFIPAFILSIFFTWDYGLGSMMYLGAPWVRGLIIILFYMTVQWCENNLIVPRVMGHNLNLHPLTVIFALLVGGLLSGVFGMLLALPISACLKVVFEIYYTPFIDRIDELISRKPMALTGAGENGSSPEASTQEISQSRTYE